jgi:hypothetical protein
MRISLFSRRRLAETPSWGRFNGVTDANGALHAALADSDQPAPALAATAFNWWLDPTTATLAAAAGQGLARPVQPRHGLKFKVESAGTDQAISADDEELRISPRVARGPLIRQAFV